jgi:hypothetical protein
VLSKAQYRVARIAPEPRIIFDVGHTMRFLSILTFAVLGSLTIGIGGCATAQQSTRHLSVAVAIIGTQTISAQQVVQIHQALRPELESAGYTLADSNATADLVLTVSFIPIPGGPGGRIKLTSLEPTAQFRRATEGASDTSEAKEWRRLERDLQAIVEAQGRNPDSR